jgi:hypothetical protein
MEEKYLILLGKNNEICSILSKVLIENIELNKKFQIITGFTDEHYGYKKIYEIITGVIFELKGEVKFCLVGGEKISGLQNKDNLDLNLSNEDLIKFIEITENQVLEYSSINELTK